MFSKRLYSPCLLLWLYNVVKEPIRGYRQLKLWIDLSNVNITNTILLLLFYSHRRVTRSNSVTAAVQADLDLPEDISDEQFIQTQHGLVIRQSSRDAATSTVSIQGSGNHYHACTQDDYSDVDFDPSILPPPVPWMDGATEEEYGCGVTVSVCPQDGRWFLKLLQAEMERMEGWCRQMEQEERKNELPEESE